MCLYLRNLFSTKRDEQCPLISRARPMSQLSTKAPSLAPTTLSLPSSYRSRRSNRSSSSRNSSSSASSSSSCAPSPPRSRQPSISLTELTRREINAALEAIAEALPNMPYAIIGGVACQVLGSPRPTKDIDIVVPDGRAAEAAALLAAEGQFGTETSHAGRRRVWFNASHHHHYNVDVLEPHDIGQVFPNGVPETVPVGTRRHPVLDPKQLLNFKIASWTDRMGTHGIKKINHARDIMFLVDYLARKGVKVDRGEVYHATDDFMIMFFASYPGSMAAFEKVGLVRSGSSRNNSIDDHGFGKYHNSWW